MSPAFDLATKLQTLGFGTIAAESGVSIAVSTEPDAPDECITVYDTGGAGPDTHEMDLLRPTIQVRVRARTYAAGYARMRAIQIALIAILSETLDTYKFIMVQPISDILAIGRDENDRFHLTSNYQLLLEVAAT